MHAKTRLMNGRIERNLCTYSLRADDLPRWKSTLLCITRGKLQIVQFGMMKFSVTLGLMEQVTCGKKCKTKKDLHDYCITLDLTFFSNANNVDLYI